jgi:hypothetical protein
VTDNRTWLGSKQHCYKWFVDTVSALPQVHAFDFRPCSLSADVLYSLPVPSGATQWLPSYCIVASLSSVKVLSLSVAWKGMELIT